MKALTFQRSDPRSLLPHHSHQEVLRVRAQERERQGEQARLRRNAQQ